MQQESFKFLLNGKIFTVPPFKKLMDLSRKIQSKLIFSQQHQYEVESKVSNELFENFINYLINDDVPDIEISNINEYDELSIEFEQLRSEVESKKTQFGHYLVNLNGLRYTGSSQKTKYEEEIAAKLDDYILKYGIELMKSPIQSLHIIFNHEKRNLTVHNEAYELIKKHFEKTNDSNVFILLDSLDGTKLTRSNIEESFSLFSVRNNHMPKVEFAYLSEVFSNQRKQDERISILEKKLEQQTKEYQNLNEKQKIIEQENKKYQNEIQTLKDQIKSLTAKFEQIKNNEQAISISYNCKPFTAEINKNTPGILCRLKMNEKSPFDRLFIASQSSNDIYNIIDPNTNDCFCLTDIGSFIEFELEKFISINGIKIFSSTFDFPKSFDIEVNGKIVSSIIDAKELNGENREMTISFDSIQCKKIRFINKSKNWDEGDSYLRIKKIELLSKEVKFVNGVFQTFVYQSENHDPHKCPVNITSSSFDLTKFYLVDASDSICTYDIEDSWFQIEFAHGTAILKGFRLNRQNEETIKSYKIVCTDDIFKPEKEWITLIEINEKSSKEHQLLDIYKFSQPSPPIKFVRMIQKGSNWSGNHFLRFCHLDFFGTYN